MGSFLYDIRYGCRLLFKSPGFSIVAVFTLALGIGANTAIFSVINAVLLRSLPYKDPSRIAWISGTNTKNGIESEPASIPDFLDWRRQNHSFEDMAALTGFIAELRGGGEPESVMAGAVSANYFSVLGVQPQFGRDFSWDDAQPGKDNVIIVGNGFWQTRLGGAPGAIGSVITIGDRPFTVIGVMPPSFVNARPFDYKPMQIWKPLQLAENSRRRSDFLSVFARLKPGVSIERAQSDLNQVAETLERTYPGTNTGWRTRVSSLHQRWVGNVRPALLILTAAVSFLLLIACANIANLLLARAASRERELTVRAALGAGKRRLVQQLLTESALFAILGGLLGILLAWWGVRVLVALSPNLVPLGKAGIDLRVLGFTLVLSILTGFLFGLFPALQVSRGASLHALKEGSRNVSEGIGGRRTRDTLAAAEIALALVLLIGAGLMIRSFIRLQRVDPGFQTGHLLIAMILAPRDHREANQVSQFYERLIAEVQSIPGIQGTAAVAITPLMGESNVLGFQTEDKVVGTNEQSPAAEYATCTPGYFRLMGIPLLSGRLFNEFDTQNREPVVIVNQTLTHRYWSNENPLGKRIKLDPSDSWRTVVGVVGDTRSEGLSVTPSPQIYAPHSQNPEPAMFVVSRTTGDPLLMTQAVKTRVWSVDGRQTFWVLTTMENIEDGLLAGPRFNMLLMIIFAGVAAVIASVGIYGVISYSVTRRTREIGIRVAIGATRRSVLGLVVGRGLAVTLVGLGAGLIGAFALTRLMSSLLFSVTPTDGATFAGVSLLLGLISLLACYLPARRATRVDPMVALRYE